MRCIECYSEDNKATPLLNKRDCLENHKQYICSTCKRCICIDLDEKRKLQRWNFPFKSLEIALLYLKTAEFTVKKPCGIYEIICKNGRKSYKIFSSKEDFLVYLEKNKDKSSETECPVYITEKYLESPNAKVKYLTKDEVEKYLKK